MKQRGFATIFALTATALVAAGLSAVAIALHVEAVRTQSWQTKAELRQLLMAGADDAVARAAAWPATPPASDWSIQLPAGLPAARLKAHSEPGAAQLLVRIDAELSSHHAEQELRFQLEQNRWTLQSAHLGGR